ncbi:MAG: ABC transporter ATP-binding protein [Dehalococcoidales bacterium]|nr:ABC transporter ATP-binding protein [Dehalococcoidales bacterium]
MQIIILLVLSLLVGGLEAAIVVAIYPILNAALDMGTTLTGILGIFQKIANSLPVQDEFISFCIVFIIVALITFMVRLVNIIYRSKFSTNLVKRHQSNIFHRLMLADYQYFIDNKQGDLIYNIAVAPSQLSTLVLSATELVSQVVLSVSVIILLFSLSWRGTIIVLGVALLYYFSTRFIAKDISYPAGKGERDAASEGNTVLTESIAGIKQIKTFTTAGNWINRFAHSVERRWNYSFRQIIWQQIPPYALMALLYISIGFISITIKVSSPEDFIVIIPLFGTFAFAAFRLSPIMSSVGIMTMQIMGALPNSEVVYRLENEELSKIRDGSLDFSAFKSEIEFDNVTFIHKGRSKTLNNISLCFEKGKTTAIVGRSGAGKTTIVNLLLRLFDPTGGEINIDGIDLRDFKLESWLNKVGFVSQDIFMINDTIENNITFYANAYTQEEIMNAAKYADAHSFIMELPEGYNTMLGDKGMKLSGGQAQRVAVARAMIRNPEVLIFDEATNNLDTISELAVQRAIEQIARDHTVIIIAHRLSTIANADKIIMLKDGQVIEQGTHEELLEKKGLYWELYRSQKS